MAVFSLSRPESIEPGVYPFDPRKHLRQVADLVGTVFADEMDAEGRNMLREMQMVGWLSPILGGLLTPAFLGDYVAGYVWAEGERVLGNVTLQRVDYGGTRWRISNVAVAPEHRGQGIARALMQSSLSEIAQQGGSWAVLQVRADNPSARHLYESLGFTAVCLDGIWKLASLPKTPEPDPRVPLHPLPARAWRDRYELAQASQTQLAHWASPVEQLQYDVGLLRWAGEAIGNLTGLYRVERWGLRTNNFLEGSIETVASTMGEMHKLRFAVRPEARGRLEGALVSQGLRTLIGSPPAPVIVEHSGDHVEGVAALEAAGFRSRRVLLTMRRQITPADVLL
jgi:ribosomal protein S18 acetylase RimI-like enzyme